MKKEAKKAFPRKPHIRKLGTIFCNNIVETTPLVYKGELYRFEVVRRKSFAAEKNVTLLLKGADTVTAAPDGRVCFNPTGNPGLAKGGSGDVLAGICAGILTWSQNAFDAAAVGAYLHGAAGDMLKEEYSEYGYLTGELAKAAAKKLGAILNGENT